MNKELLNNIAALIGLAGAINNSVKTANTDKIVIDALLNKIGTKEIHDEKFIISPSCKDCLNPCGNTSDYDLAKLEDESKEILDLKYQIIEQLVENAKENKINDITYNALSYLGYELKVQSYQNLLEELKK